MYGSYLLLSGHPASSSTGVIAALVLGLGLVWMGAALWSERPPLAEAGLMLANERGL